MYSPRAPSLPRWRPLDHADLPSPLPLPNQPTTHLVLFFRAECLVLCDIGLPRSQAAPPVSSPVPCPYLAPLSSQLTPSSILFFSTFISSILWPSSITSLSPAKIQDHFEHFNLPVPPSVPLLLHPAPPPLMPETRAGVLEATVFFQR